jgi:S-adenosylmethionine synthetase
MFLFMKSSMQKLGGIKMDTAFYFTSESVSKGHPDKMADLISDSILDAFLEKDPNSRVACEVLLTKGLAVIAGEITSKATVDYEKIVKGVLKENFELRIQVQHQSEEIAEGVQKGGAGDQGTMFGFACQETKELMPLPIMLAHALINKLDDLKEISYLHSDAKSQVTVAYDADFTPLYIKNVVISIQHDPGISQELISHDIQKMPREVIPSYLVNENTRFFINSAGSFEIGGLAADTGLTGRKIIVDSYGGMARAGGGAFSGKDPSKMDRSAAYAARYIAKNIVAAELAKRCEVQISYAIGIEKPIVVNINTFGTEAVENGILLAAVNSTFDLSPKGIVNMLDLLNPIYFKTAVGGHFGRENDSFTWEKTDKVKILLQQVALQRK